MEILKYNPTEIIAGGKMGMLVADDGNGLAYTSPGTRANNEDGIMLVSGMIAVADGMGGHEAGEKASLFALAGVNNLKNKPIDNNFFENVCDFMARQNLPEKSGTTLAVAKKIESEKPGMTKIELGHVGDSKILVISLADKRILWESKDQSLVQEMFDHGIIKDPIQRYVNHNSHVITNAMYAGRLKESPQTNILEVPTGSAMVVIYTDGIADVVSPEEILPLVLRSRQLAGEDIMDLALDRHQTDFDMMINGRLRFINKSTSDNISLAIMML